ncbi:MAG: dTDP-4-dehydrorhamnose reductase [Sphingobacteriales bacterium 12-47-4]|nr:MAG: dTDP-4-dehydrorhamnose reductase [Sphingobacteriales bacterium 12-47-4]
MKILVTGANGLLGQYLVKQLLLAGYAVVATGKGENRHPVEALNPFVYYDMDILDEPTVNLVMEKERPDVVVHAAAMTQVDDCEKDTERAEAVNVKGTAQVLVNAEAISAQFIYVSTDFVFDGEKGMYIETDECNPVNFYGFTKLQAEAITETSTIPFAIVRTCLVYGQPLHGKRSNIFSWVKSSLESGQMIRVVDDQWRTPTYVEDLAAGIVLIIQQKATGTYHLSGEEGMSPFGFACRVAAHFGLNPSLIERVTADTFTQPGRRPPKTGFVIQKAKSELGFAPRDLDQGFRSMFPVGG